MSFYQTGTNKAKLIISSKPFRAFFLLAANVVSITLVVFTYSQLVTMSTFEHDEVHYLDSFQSRLIGDGRWLNFLLFDTIRFFDLSFWSVIYVLLVWSSSFFILSKFLDNLLQSSLIASAFLLSPPVAQQSLWPATASVGLFVLVFLLALSRANLPHWLIYILGGVLLFGTVQTLYLILPLFFLAQFETLGIRRNVRRASLLIVNHLFFWILGSIVGFMTMNTVVRFLSGRWVTPMSWRETKSIDDFEDLFDNASRMVGFLERDFFYMAQLSFPGILLSVAVFLAIREYFVDKERIESLLSAMLMAILVGVALYVFFLPLAPNTPTRSLSPLYLGFLSLLGLLFVARTKNSGLTLYASVGIVLSLSFNYHVAAQDSFLFHKSFVEKAKELFQIPDLNHGSSRVVFVEGEYFPEGQSFGGRLNSQSRLNSIARSEGFSRLIDCRPESRSDSCPVLLVGEYQSKRDFLDVEVAYFVDSDDNLRLRIGIPVGDS